MTRYFFPLFIIITFVTFFRLGSVTLFDVDEAVFAEATREMVESGNWITPTYNGDNRYDKPIFFYWLMGASFKIFGINEFAARFPSALSGLLLCLAVFFFIRRFYNEKIAFYATVSLALSLYFIAYSHAAVTDMTLTLFITLSIFSFFLSIKHKETEGFHTKSTSEKTDGYIYGFYIFSAFAFLTKGLVGIIFPFGIAATYLLFAGNPKKLFSKKKLQSFLKGISILFIISAPWYITQLVINGQEFFQQFVIKHHFYRYTDIISGHTGPIYYFIPALVVGLFPWSAFLPAGIRHTFREKNNVSLLSFVWVVFIFVFFSLSKTKLPNYILPAIPPLTILIASGITVEDKIWRRTSNVLIVIVSMVMASAFLMSKKYLIKFGINDINWVYYASGLMIFMAIAVLISELLPKIKAPSEIIQEEKQPTKDFLKLLPLMTIMFCFFILLSLKALPALSQYLQGTLYKYSLYAKDRLYGDERIITYRINNPSIVFYSGHKIVSTTSVDELFPLITGGRKLILIAKIKDIEIIKEVGFKLLEKGRTYAIFERK